MRDIVEGTKLWEPSDKTLAEANLTLFMKWLASEKSLPFDAYSDLWQWSVSHLADFWHALWQYFDVIASAEPKQILQDDGMPNVTWFEGARLNWAENIMAKQTDKRPCLLYQNEVNAFQEVSWTEIVHQTAVLQQTLTKMGVHKGDRVVAYLPNIPEAVIGVLAVTSLGAIWSSGSPDFGTRSILDRFSQIEPKVLLAVDGYHYNSKPFDRLDVVAALQQGLPSLEQTILIPQLTQTPDRKGLQNTHLWPDILSQERKARPLHFEQVPFDHPLWVLYSSGTTGLPKPIVHGHGGVLLEQFKSTVFHNDLKSTDRFFWFTSTGWMMWNYLVGSLLSGCTIILYNGSPGFPSLEVLWQLVEKTQMTYFGLSPAFISACMKANIVPRQTADMSRLRAIGSTGAPLPAAAFAWIYDQVKTGLAVESLSGGTDLCTAFVGGVRILPIYAGELQGASLGAAVQAFGPDGDPVINQVGELVITKPMPSMPIYFWNDPGNARYLSSYFEMYPQVWRHGDWIKINERGGCVIYGRSDSTINRKGIRMGTSEIYQAVESLPEVLDSLIVDLELLGRDSFLPLFVILREGLTLDEALKQRINQKLRQDISPRHVPDKIYQVAEIPYTLSGKKMEIPVRRILLGQDAAKAANAGAMRNPNAIQYFIKLAQTL